MLLSFLGGCDRQSGTPVTAAAPTPVTEPVVSPTPPPPPVPAPITEAVLVGAGDIAECGQQGAVQTAALLDGIPGTVFTAGDNVYMNGTPREFECYDATWGRHRSRTYPTPGNHDYGTPDASGYFQYFGERAGPVGQGFYSFDAGAWHVVSLNSNMFYREGSAQLHWLRRDLQQAQARCVAAIMHHPLVSSGPNGDNPHVRDLWRALQDAGADIVIAAHDHIYERHGRMNADGRADQRGARLFVVGTGEAPASTGCRAVGPPPRPRPPCGASCGSSCSPAPTSGSSARSRASSTRASTPASSAAHSSSGALPRRVVEAQEAGRVVVQDVALLLRRQLVGVLDDPDRVGHQLRPHELVGAEHHAVRRSRVHKPSRAKLALD